MAIKLKTAPSGAVVSTSEAKLHLRIDASDEDALIDALVLAATADAEHLMGRALLTQEWQLTLDSFFDPTVYSEPVPITIDLIRGPTVTTGATALNLSRPPVTSITSIKYIDNAGTLQTMTPSDYILAAASDYTARVVPAFGKTWPATRAVPEAVQVVFACGYANAAAVPELIKAWIKMRVSALYENKAAWTLGKAIERNEFVDRLLDRYRVWAM